MTDMTDPTNENPTTGDEADQPLAPPQDAQPPGEAGGGDEPEVEPEAEGGPGYILTTLGEYGQAMPMGATVGETLNKNFEARRWTFKQERALGKLKEENQGMSVGEHVTAILTTMMTVVGPHRFTDEMSDAEKQLIITQQYMGDVLYMYAFLRTLALGRNLDSLLPCPHCTFKNARTLDLGELDVRVIKEPKSLLKRVELYDGLRIFGEERKTLFVRPPLWLVMHNPDMTSGGNEADRTAVLFKDCIVGADGIPDAAPIVIADPDLDEMSKRDIELLTAAIEDSPGPQMAIESKCTRCKQPALQIVNWQYDNFFGTSSQSSHTKR